MDNHDNDNHPSRIISTPANPWGHRFGFSDWRGGVQHEWRTNLGGNLNAFQITTILRSNPVQWSDYTSIKKEISFNQIEIWNMEHSVEHFKRYISYDEPHIERLQEELDRYIEQLIRWRTNENQVYPSCTDPHERHNKRNVVMNKIMTYIFDSTCKLYEKKIHMQSSYDELAKLNSILKETKNKLTKLVKAILETDPHNELLYLGPSY